MTNLLTRPALSSTTEVIFEHIGFEPNKDQLPILACRKRFIMVAGGEQAGKSRIASAYVHTRGDEVPSNERGLYWLVASDYERTRAEFEYLLEDFSQMGLVEDASKRVDPGFIQLTDGTRFETKSGMDPRKLAMFAPHGIIGCEASQLDLETFNKIMFRLGPKRGWLFLAGTFESSLGWYPSLFSAWQSGANDRQSFSLPTWTNTALYPGGRYDPEIVRMEKEADTTGRSDDFFIERIAGRPVPPRGLVFPTFRADLHVSEEAEYVPGEPVWIANDPGYGRSANAVLAVQHINGQARVFDEVYEHGVITSSIIENFVMVKPWYKDVEYVVVDIAGKAHAAMPAVHEAWQELTKLSVRSEKIDIEPGIERMKSFLKLDERFFPRIVINPKCRGLLSEFGAAPNPFDGQTKAYRYATDKEGNVVGTKPEDRYNDAIKALTYFLWIKFGPVDSKHERRFATVTRHGR